VVEFGRRTNPLNALITGVQQLQVQNVSKLKPRLALVWQITNKIEGDDSMHMMDLFEDFLKRQNGKWMAQLSIHTNHEPHPALPEWYNAYEHAEGGPAGDYLGTISQMDAAFGRMVSMLQENGQYDNTMIWFTADNGAHTGGRPSGQLSASNGLRQCKASLFEGGIRVPGFVHWPSVIKTHVETDHAAVTYDFLPTILDLLGLEHPHPEWKADGVSLLPLLRGTVPATSRREKGIGWHLNAQLAYQEDFGAEGVWKIVQKPNKGQCDDFLEPFGSMKDLNGPFLFHLTADPTESTDLCSQEKEKCDAMFKSMHDFRDSVDYSRQEESGCEAKGSSRLSNTVPDSGDSLMTPDGMCLTVENLDKHGVVTVDACDAGSRWEESSGHLKNAAADKNNLCLKVDSADGPCVEGSTIWLGPCTGSEPGFSLDGEHLVTAKCPGMCAVPASKEEVFTYTSRGVALGDCDSGRAFVFSRGAVTLV